MLSSMILLLLIFTKAYRQTKLFSFASSFVAVQNVNLLISSPSQAFELCL